MRGNKIIVQNGEQKMNLLKKTTPWMTASIFAVASLFGQNNDNKPCTDKDANNRQSKCVRSFEQGQDILKTQAMPSYLAPATIQVRGSWDLFVVGSFIYWQPTQDNMEYGLTNSKYAGNVVGTTTTTTPANSGLFGNWLQQSFSFQPGFKVGVGLNTDHDNWDLYAEYTWLRDKTTSTSNGPATGDILPTRGLAFNSAGTLGANAYTSANQQWTCNLDFLNLEMGRGCYFGRALTIRPAFGVRGTVMRQKLFTTYTNSSVSANSAFTGIATVQDYVHSWSVGPRAGLYSNWLLGSRFRLYGNVAGDACFTQYSMQFKDEFLPTSGTNAGQNTRLKSYENNLGVLRTHLEMEMGIGWGSYFDNDNWYFDLSAGYTWQVFFDQNMFRNYGTAGFARGTFPSGNLYINGLTVNVRLDF